MSSEKVHYDNCMTMTHITSSLLLPFSCCAYYKGVLITYALPEQQPTGRAEMFSQAYNNANCLFGQPDPQTGTFSMGHNFGSLQANAGFGPSYDFSMSFGLLSTLGGGNNTGVGAGFALKLGGYSFGSQTITLNGGDSYKVFWQGAGEWDLSHKAKDIVVHGNGIDEAYIYHKNGDVEFLKSDFGSNSDMYLSRYTAADGRYLNFSYFYQNSYYRLTKVEDSDNVLATIDYDDNNNKATITVHPSSSKETKTFTLNFNGDGCIWRIETPAGDIGIEYDPYVDGSGNVMFPISKITYPTGATESVEYQRWMQLPIGAPVNQMPAISKHTKTVASNQPDIVTTYEYDDSGYNYWGNHSGVSWQDNYDGLFNCYWAYRYVSTTFCGSKKTVATYNKFHQTVQTLETNGDDNTTKTTNYDYYCNEDVVFDEQEMRYELQKSKSIVVQDSSGASNTFTETYEYDDYANLLSKVEPNGTSTVNVYYAAGGEDGCPANPHGLVGFIKSETMHPNDGSAGRTKTYTYKLATAVDGVTDRCIVTDTKSFDGNTVVVSHFDSGKAQCLPSKQVVTVGGKASTKTFDFTFNDDSFTVQETTTGFDGLSFSTSTTSSILRGLTLQEIDRTGVKTNYTYDVLGRVLTTVTAATTDYEATTTYTYTDNPNGSIGTLISQTTSTGLATNLLYDGDQKELTIEKQDRHGVMRKTKETSYDGQGREVTETNFDYSIADDQSIEETYTDAVTKVYGYWGEVKEEQFNGGATGIETIVIDPIKLQRTTQLVTNDYTPVAGATVITYNLFSKEEQVDILTLSGSVYSTTKKTYNGFGLVSSTTTPMSASASMKYDNYDRPTEATHFDGTVISMEYPDFTSKRLMSSMKLASSGYVLGQHEFDGLLRITSRTINDVKTQFSYEGAYSKPSRLVNGRGQTILFDYIPELGLQTAKKSTFSSKVDIGDWKNKAKVSEATFDYGNPSKSSGFLGRIVSASYGDTANSVQYNSKGFITSATQTIGGTSKTLTNSKSSLMGMPLQYSFDSRSMTVSYDQYGRIVKSTDGNISAEAEYDSDVDRLKKETVKENGSTVRTTDFTYDDYSREASRTITCGGKTIVIDQSFDLENKVTQRKTTIDSSDTLTEDFTYDSKRRLLTYTATTTVTALLPQNEYGKAFKSQSFTYDEINNIKSIITKFPNGDSDTATLTYDSSKRFQLKQISHTLTSGSNAYPGKIAFTYDADGHILTVGDTTMTYTISGRLSSRGSVSYSYDAFDRLVQSGSTMRFYSGTNVIQEVNGSSVNDFIFHRDKTIAQVSDGKSKIFGFNFQSSIVSVTDGSSTATTTYGPFGSGDNGARFGFNGELKDISDPNYYPLGNGTRGFMAGVGRFLSSDTLYMSSGEINPYAYCDADPVNAADPSGHGLFKAIFGLIIGIASTVLAIATGGSALVVAAGIAAGVTSIVSSSLKIAAEVEAKKGNTELANKLLISSTAFAIVSTVLSLGTTAASSGKVLKTRSVFKTKNKGTTFRKFLNDNDAISFKTKHRINFHPKSSQQISTEMLREVKVRPDGIFRGKDIPKVKFRAGNFIKTTQVPITKSKLLTETGKLRSIPSTLKQTGCVTSIVLGTVGLAVTTFTVATYTPFTDEKESNTPSSETGVDLSHVSSCGIPTNPQSFYDDPSDGEDEGDDDDLM